MYFTIHLLAGAAVGAVTASPVAGFAAGVASHAGLDMVPHHDYHTVRPGALDVALGLFLLGLFMRGGMIGLPSFLGAVGGTIPDLEVVISHLGRMNAPRRNFFPTHSGVLIHPKLRLPWGALIQVAVAGMCLLFLLR